MHTNLNYLLIVPLVLSAKLLFQGRYRLVYFVLVIKDMRRNAVAVELHLCGHLDHDLVFFEQSQLKLTRIDTVRNSKTDQRRRLGTRRRAVDRDLRDLCQASIGAIAKGDRPILNSAHAALLHYPGRLTKSDDERQGADTRRTGNVPASLFPLDRFDKL